MNDGVESPAQANVVSTQSHQVEAIVIAANIVSAYVANNSMPAAELPAFLQHIYNGLQNVGMPMAPVEEVRKDPAVPIKKSIAQDYIICLEDGRKFRTMKRHLLAKYNMTPDQYRSKWGLPGDYPMTARAYSEARSTLAKASGLGRARGAAAARKKTKAKYKKAA